MLDEREGEVNPQDLPMAFNRQPLWARVAIVAAGPLANLILAVCLYASTFWIGHYETQAILSKPVVGSIAEDAGIHSGDKVLRVGLTADDLEDVRSLDSLRSWIHQNNQVPVWLELESQGQGRAHVLSLLPPSESDLMASGGNGWLARGFSGAWSRAVLSNVQSGLAADAAGLLRGDEIQKINGRWVGDASHLRTMVRESGHEPLSEPQVWEIFRIGQGRLWVDVTPERVLESHQYIGRIGAQLGEPPAMVWVQYGFFDGLSQGVFQTADVVRLTVTMLGSLITGRASLEHLSGPLAMADYAGRSASLGVVAYLSYLALVSVSLGVFNLLPLPVLDGGHLLYYLYEACTGHPPSPQWVDLLQRGGLILLVGLMVFSLFNDVVRLGWLS